MIARARSYVLIDGMLYKKGVVQPLLKCITKTEGRDLLQEIHSGICGSNIGPRALSAKAIRQGFYCPTHIKDVEQIIKTCQSTSPHQSKPSTPTQIIPPTRSLQRWGIDLVGPLPPSQGEQICSSSHRIFYKVDRGQDTHQNHIGDSKEVLLAEYNLQIRSTKNPNS